MKERPIIMTGESVKAILDGRKTMTRRVMKPQPNGKPLRWREFSWFEGASMPDIAPACPYGIKGDRLWVKETFQMAATMNVCHAADDYVIYRATDPDWESSEDWKWKSPIFMSRDASRILLEITDIRVERVQEISEEDARAEGATAYPFMASMFFPDKGLVTDPTFFRSRFYELWDRLNAKRGFSWGSNPFVWVIAFKVLKEVVV